MLIVSGTDFLAFDSRFAAAVWQQAKHQGDQVRYQAASALRKVGL
jgi:hypothetical protein